ncbi:MAG TPA: hypothetical protein VFG84_02270 [Gemmatimonadaceae bacterium]|nr:hypothetical protein [Gemmatimonadaceae bacterium]
MAFDIEERFEVPVPVGRVYNTLVDLRHLVRCLPGTEITGRGENESVRLQTTLQIGPTAVEYSGAGRLTAANRGEHLVMLRTAATSEDGAGALSMQARIRAEPLPELGTVVTVSANVTLGASAEAEADEAAELEAARGFVRGFTDGLERLIGGGPVTADTPPVAASSLQDTLLEIKAAPRSGTDAEPPDEPSSSQLQHTGAIPVVKRPTGAGADEAAAAAAAARASAHARREQGSQGLAAAIAAWFSRLFGGGR